MIGSTTNIEMAMAKFESFGLPGILGPVIGWLEVVAGGLLLVGLWTQWMSLLLAAIMVCYARFYFSNSSLPISE